MSRRKYSITLASLPLLFAGSLLAQTNSNQVAKGPTPKVAIPSVAKSASATLVDLNSATKQVLMTLPGINDASAQKIIENRPYRSKTDLTDKKVISADAYARIAGRVVAKTSTRVSPGNVEKRAASSKGTSEVQKKYE